eukprot:545419-Prymnesium_polylepis.1
MPPSPRAAHATVTPRCPCHRHPALPVPPTVGNRPVPPSRVTPRRTPWRARAQVPRGHAWARPGGPALGDGGPRRRRPGLPPARSRRGLAAARCDRTRGRVTPTARQRATARNSARRRAKASEGECARWCVRALTASACALALAPRVCSQWPSAGCLARTVCGVERAVCSNLPRGPRPCVRAAQVRDIGAAHGKSAAQVALRWVLQLGHPLVTSTESVRHMVSDLDVIDWALSEEEMATLSALDTHPDDPTPMCIL